ncbi:MAG: Triosephosphate isomerase, bacterial/eukaryotic [Gemmatimonadetes bacterium]|nr:Triosephosphate isomerase, bacterial/eukaryotic [Gemmatimonadota bacterium]
MASTRTPVLAANWKMHHGPTAASAFLESFLIRHAPRDDRSVILFPSALALAAARHAAAARPDIQFGVQNIHTAEKGAFTGETSATIAAEAGAQYVLVGHSERRHVFGETDAETAEKCARATAHGLVPMLCVGEKIEEREAGETEAVVLRQLRAGLAALSASERLAVMIAYEPVWAIGTGRTATPQDATSAHQAIRSELRAMGGAATDVIPILYGGSVNAGNAASLLGAPGVDGLLVGGASLEAESWASICNA